MPRSLPPGREDLVGRFLPVRDAKFKSQLCDATQFVAELVYSFVEFLNDVKGRA
jgi:hypothetical protein